MVPLWGLLTSESTKLRKILMDLQINHVRSLANAKPKDSPGLEGDRKATVISSEGRTNFWVGCCQ